MRFHDTFLNGSSSRTASLRPTMAVQLSLRTTRPPGQLPYCYVQDLTTPYRCRKIVLILLDSSSYYYIVSRAINIIIQLAAIYICNIHAPLELVQSVATVTAAGAPRVVRKKNRSSVTEKTITCSSAYIYIYINIGKSAENPPGHSTTIIIIVYM